MLLYYIQRLTVIYSTKRKKTQFELLSGKYIINFNYELHTLVQIISHVYVLSSIFLRKGIFLVKDINFLS